MLRFLTAMAAAIQLAAISAPPSEANLAGVWRTPTGELVRLVECAGAICGDAFDPASPSTPGDRILSNFGGGPRIWTGGRIVNPRNHRSYSGRLRLRSAVSLEVTGCVARFFCGTQVWKREPR